MYKPVLALLSIVPILLLHVPSVLATDDLPSAFHAPVVTGPNGSLVNKAFIHHGEELFKKKLYKVSDGVYNVVGLGLSTATMIEGDTELIIIDTDDSIELAEDQIAEFRKVSDKPVKAVLYTHSHYALGTKQTFKNTPISQYYSSSIRYIDRS